MSEARETEEERALRHRRRLAFDAVAVLYDEARPTYATEVVDRMIDVAGVRRADARVLEVGCGTGQLTRHLAHYGFELVAIDPGPSTLQVARQRLAGTGVSFRLTTFEAFEAPAGSLDLIVAAAAFHWVDPEVWWTKCAALLQGGGAGWLAVIDSDTRWDEPVQSELRKLWLRHSEHGTAWATQPRPTMTQRFEETGLFGPVVSASASERRTDSSDDVARLLRTTASFLTYTEPTKAAFLRDLDDLLEANPTIGAEQVTTLTAAPTRG